MKASQKTAAFVFLSITLVVIFSFVWISKKEVSVGSISASETPEFVAQKQAQIIAIVSGNIPLSAKERDTLFSALSGPSMLRFHFTEAEKILIVKAINAQSDVKKSTKKSSSAFLFASDSRFKSITG